MIFFIVNIKRQYNFNYSLWVSNRFLNLDILLSGMRIWDIPPEKLCRQHLLGEHRELHAIWSILTKNKKGYSHHPETVRWNGKLRALYLLHEEIVKEMKLRGFNHNSPLDDSYVKGKSVQKDFVTSVENQIKTLKIKKCKCKV
jgi:hypothetical protein